MIGRKILILDLVFVVGSILLAGGLFSFVSLEDQVVLSPGESSAILMKLDDVNRISIDDNYDLISPQIYEVEEGVVIALEPGIYYWKLDRNLFSEIRKVETDVAVSFVLKEVGENEFFVVNVGDEELKVDQYEHDGDYQKSFTLVGGLDE
jgi:hypothetical protein